MDAGSQSSELDVSDDCEQIDRRLLRQYADEGDQQAFATVVQRHLRLVYAAAVRRVGDRHLAEEVTQAVFLILAKRAGSAGRERALSGWLLTTVRYAAANALRIERRRLRRERAVAVPVDAHATDACSADPSEVLIWREIRAQLDDAVLQLPSPDRHVVLLRFFEQRPIRDIAASMQVSEGAIKQRLARANEKLRQRLSADLGLAGLLGGEQFMKLFESQLLRRMPTGGMPSGLRWISRVGHGAGPAVRLGGSPGVNAISKGAINMMKWTRIKLAAAVLVVAMGGGIGGWSQLHRAAAQEATSQPHVALVPPDNAQATFDRLIQAVQANDRDAFIKDSTDAVKRGITPQTLAAVNRDIAPDLAKGYDRTFLGTLKQQGCEVQLWKVSFKDGRDDALGRVSTQTGLVAGFFIQ